MLMDRNNLHNDVERHTFPLVSFLRSAATIAIPHPAAAVTAYVRVLIEVAGRHIFDHLGNGCAKRPLQAHTRCPISIFVFLILSYPVQSAVLLLLHCGIAINLLSCARRDIWARLLMLKHSSFCAATPVFLNL